MRQVLSFVFGCPRTWPNQQTVQKLISAAGQTKAANKATQMNGNGNESGNGNELSCVELERVSGCAAVRGRSALNVSSVLKS